MMNLDYVCGWIEFAGLKNIFDFIWNNVHINKNYYFPYQWMYLVEIHSKNQCFYVGAGSIIYQ